MSDFQKAALAEMIQHDQALEIFPFLSAQILNRWRRDGRIRFFRGKEGKISYPRSDLDDALNKELSCGETQDQGDFGNTRTNGSAQNRDGQGSTATGTMTEADALREKLFLRSLSKKPKKSLSNSSGPISHQAKTPEKSGSLMS